MSLENLEDVYELTPTQHGMLFHTLYAQQSGVYTEQIIYRLRGEVNAAVLEKAWQQAADRQPILRTSFFVEDLDKPVQLVHRRVTLPLEQQDWRALPPVEQEKCLKSLLETERGRGFKLSEAPLMRLILLRVSDGLYHFICHYHHAILDGWSYSLLLKEVFVLYDGCLRGESIYVKTTRPYGDYIEWLRRQDLMQAEKYWRRELKGVTTPIFLGIDSAPRSLSVQDAAYQELSFQWSGEKMVALRSFARRSHLTVSTIVHGIWALLLSHYSAEEDVVFGTTVSGRTADLNGIESMIGLFLNTLPVRVKVSWHDSVLPWLRGLQGKLVELRHYEYSPLVEVQGWSEVPRGQPLFETIVVFENYPVDGSLECYGSFTIDDVRYSPERTNYPITLLVVPGESLSVQIIFECRRFDPAAIARLLGHFQELLGEVIANPEQPLSELALLAQAERHQLLVEWNDTKKDYPKDKCIHELFEAQVERSPDAVAVVCEGQRLTYRELDDRAQRLARQLRAIGVRPDVLVGVCMERSVDLVVGLLAVLKAGGAYVPIDPAYPAERIGLMIEDSAMKVLLTQERVRGHLPQSRCRVVSLEQLASEGELHASEVTQESAGAENLAYVIYTSGSTGRPKGVEIQHKALVNFLHSMGQRPGLTPQDVLLSVTTISFDIAGLELFLPLVVGACVVIVGREVALDGRRLMEQLDNSGASVMQATPATWRMLVDAGWSGSKELKILCGGEALSGELANQLLERGASLWNLYGPTESTIWSTLYRVESVDGAVPIGRPIANTEIYILDRYLKPVPVGVPGELYIGGAGLARGYLNRPELTEGKFIGHPFSTEPSARLYKTGDLARYLSDGNIEFLGRIDHQVKLRGFRIELGEIESVLSQHPAVRETVVMVREDEPGDRRLLAYIVPNQDLMPTASELRNFLKSKLPDYMVPSAFICLDALPLTPNGKVDRRALPAANHGRPGLENSFVPPHSPVQKTLADIWAEVLKIEQIGLHDNFFDLGGHSLLLVQVHSKLQRIFDRELSIVNLFQYPTISALSDYLAGETDKQPTESPGDKLKAGKMRIAQLQRRRQQSSNDSQQNEYEAPDKL